MLMQLLQRNKQKVNFRRPQKADIKARQKMTHLIQNNRRSKGEKQRNIA